MSGLYYNNPYANPYAMQNLQYGVNMPQPQSSDAGAVSAVSGLASLIPYAGPFISAALNFAGTAYQNSKQEEFYNNYMSPQARMAQMAAAGINPAAAAQGISGSSGAQMNAAPMSSAGNGVGEQLGNSVNTALTASNIAAQTRNLEVQTEGQDLLNKISEVELGMKPSMLAAELDDLKADAQQKYQAVAQSKEEVKKIGEEIEKLKKEQSYIEAQEGAIEFDNRLKAAETRLADAKKALTESEKQLTDVNKEIQEKERDNYLTPAERIEKEAHEAAKAPVDETPQGRVKKMYLEQMEQELAPLRWQLQHLQQNHGSGAAIRSVQRKMDRVTRKYRNRMRRVDRGFAAGANFAGYGLNAGG